MDLDPMVCPVVYEAAHETPPLDALQRQLGQRFDLRRERLPAHQRTYLDTFDGRLFHAGRTLFLQRGQLVLASLEGKPLGVGPWPGSKGPAFVRDLARGPLAAELAPWVETRRLLPRVKVHRGGWHLEVLDRERQKTLVRLAWVERGASRPGGSAPRVPFPTACETLPLRGYEASLHLLLASLGDLGFRPSGRSELEGACAALGIPAAGFSSRVRLALAPHQPTHTALRVVLAGLREVAVGNLPGARQDLDPEFLHDLRVAVRRTRSVLGQVRGVFPPAAVAELRAELAWLGRETGPVRDLDVQTEVLPAHRRRLGEPFAGALEPVALALADRRKTARRRLTRTLAGPRCRQVLERWQDLVASPLGLADECPAARQPVIEVARRRLRKALRRVLEHGAPLAEDSPAEAFHELRIDAKKLRYLLEVFGSLFPADEVAARLTRLKALQEDLGLAQDLFVQEQQLTVIAQAAAAPLPPAEGAAVLLAAGHLSALLRRERQTCRATFREIFEHFAAGKEQKRWRRLLEEG